MTRQRLVDDLTACLQDHLAGVPMGLRIAEMLLSDRLALVLVAGCMLSLACLVSPGRHGVHLEGVEGVPGRRARAACSR